MYFHVEESNIFIRCTKLAPDCHSASSLPWSVIASVVSRTYVSLTSAFWCQRVAWQHDDRARGGGGAKRAGCEHLHRHVYSLMNREQMISPHWYRSNTDTNLGIDIINIWVDPYSYYCQQGYARGSRLKRKRGAPPFLEVGFWFDVILWFFKNSAILRWKY